MTRVEIYLEDISRFVRELKRAKVDRVFYTQQKNQQEVPTTDKTKPAYNLIATTILTAYVSEGEYAMEARETHTSLTISTKEEFEKFDAEVEANIKALIQKIQDDYPSCEIFKGVLVIK